MYKELIKQSAVRNITVGVIDKNVYVLGVEDLLYELVLDATLYKVNNMKGETLFSSTHLQSTLNFVRSRGDKLTKQEPLTLLKSMENYNE